MVSTAARFLFLFDFDETLIDENSDNSVVRAAPFTLPVSLSNSQRPRFFLEHSQKIMTFLNESGVTEEAVRDAIERIPASPGRGGASPLPTWLRHAGARGLFAEVFTNPAEFNRDGRLVLRPYHAHSCPECPENMCKQLILRDYASKRAKEQGEPFQKIFYIGDGQNDVCPTLALGLNDTVFPRRGFPMHRIIQDLQRTQPGVYRPSVVPWERGQDVVDFLKTIL
ncbi:putative phosphatase phospho1 [Bagarius yarrelli]|uniref:Putative phosphatase phospho1 n=1 Tax=Bagarius yarrelli TaxID=175774 RepID=A0A556VVG6_BAGYA|nr:putative phosphatase phospho1 [Bagarius yarrelli]